MLQIGSRSVQNFPLLREAGASGKPVLLKRGMMTTVQEWLSAGRVRPGRRRQPAWFFCERGIRTFEPALRNTLDVGSVVVLKALTHSAPSSSTPATPPAIPASWPPWPAPPWPPEPTACWWRRTSIPTTP